MACEWSRYNIRTNAIAPGMIVTPRIPLTLERMEAAKQGLVPMKRRGETDEIGKAVLFLASDNIRDVIAFPKNQKASDMLTGAPAAVDLRQLRDLHIKVDVPK